MMMMMMMMIIIIIIIIKAGNGDWEFYFTQDDDGGIYGRCVREPTLRYIRDGVKKVVRYLVPTFGPPVMAALMAA